MYPIEKHAKPSAVYKSYTLRFDNSIRFNFHVFWYLQFICTGSHLQEFTPMKNLDQSLVQRQNMVAYEQKIVKIAKIHDP